MNLTPCPPYATGEKKRGGPLCRFYILKWVMAIIFIACFNVTASVMAQQVTLKVKNASLENVFNSIKKQTGYAFLYRDNFLENTQSVTVNVKNVTLDAALQACFQHQPLSYEIVGKTVVIKRKPESDSKEQKEPGKPISGRVADTTGAYLPGVTVKVKNTALSTITDGSGGFTLTVPGQATLVFSFIGFQTRELSVTGPVMNIVLHPSRSALDEIKIIGYGTTTQRLATGSVSKVSGEALQNQPITDPILGLQARVPGLFITQNNGLPGSGFNILIRGRNSISQGTLPLYIIDGIPFDATNPTQVIATGSINVMNPFNSVNPGDIESIEVLKDADATSIYGSRGANGVILITTKRPKAGSLNTSLDIRTGFSKVERALHLMDGKQFRSMRREAFRNDSITPDINNAPDLEGIDTIINNDFTKTLIGGTAATTNLQFRISGGSANTQFTAGANYAYEGTVFPGNMSNVRKSLNLSVNHTSANKRFSALLTSSYAYTNSSLITTDLTSILSLPPYGFTLKDGSGKLVWTDAANAYYGNPLSYTLQPYNGQTDLLNTSGIISYKLLPELLVKANGGYNLIGYNEYRLSPLASFDPAQNIKGNAGFGNSTTRNWSLEPQIEYKRRLYSKGSIDAIIGSSFQSAEGLKNYISGSGYVSDALINTVAGAATIKATNDYSLYHYNAFFGRLSLNWNDTYLLNFTGRRDGSSRFGPGNRFANFGSVGAAWIFTGLDLFKAKLPALSFGKLRASYGTSGNDQIGNYKYLDTYTASSMTYQQSLSLQPTRLFNNKYSWEQFNKLELALELGLFSDRLFVSADFFRNKSDNQLISYSLPGQTGFSSVLVNFPGTVENKGWEFEVRSENIRGQAVSWSSSFNLTLPKNKLLRFPGLANSSYANSYAIGQPLSVLFGYQYLGVNPANGNYSVKDQNGDGVYDDKDYIILGNTDPVFYGGLQNTIRYKNISVDFLFQFVKQMGRDPVLGNSGTIGSGANLPDYILGDHWQKPGDRVTYGKFTQAYGTDLYNSYNLASLSGAQLTDASYIRLKTLSIMYALPSSWLRTISIQRLSIYAEGQNLLTFTHYKGPDPEVQSIYSLPPLRTIAFGIKANL